MAVNGSETVQITSTPSTESEDQSPHYSKLLEYGLTAPVATALDTVFKDDLVKFEDLDDRAYDALKELDESGAQAVIKQFRESNLQHVQNKSAFLCGVMKIHRQKLKTEKEGGATADTKTGPSQAKVKMSEGEKRKKQRKKRRKELLERTKYSLDITTGQRKYGGPPPKEVYDGAEPGNGCQVFIGRIPRGVFEDELVPLLEQAGTIWDFRLMMDPLTGQNRGFGFANFTTKEAASECVKKWDNYEIKPQKFLGVCVSQSNTRLFVGSIPKSKTKDEIFSEFDKLSPGLKDVIMYLQSEDKSKNRGFCFLEYIDHKSASQARRKLSSPKTKAFNSTINCDWADPIDEPSDEIMAKVKVLYIKNLSNKATEEIINTTFSAYGDVERVKKIKDYAFVHFKDRENAEKALEELNGLNLEGEPISISLAKPVDKKKKERQMERKMTTSYGNAPFGGSRGMGRGRGQSGGFGMGGGMGGMMQSYGGYGEDYFTADYMGYGFGGFDDPYGGYGPPMRPMMRRGRGMFGGAGGFPRARGARGGARGRGGRGGMARGKGGQAMKRKANFGAGHGGKRGNAAGGRKGGQWGSDPIAQQPLKQDSEQWFQDSVDDQWA